MRIKANRQSHQQARLLTFLQIAHLAQTAFAFRSSGRLRSKSATAYYAELR